MSDRFCRPHNFVGPKSTRSCKIEALYEQGSPEYVNYSNLCGFLFNLVDASPKSSQSSTKCLILRRFQDIQQLFTCKSNLALLGMLNTDLVTFMLLKPQSQRHVLRFTLIALPDFYGLQLNVVFISFHWGNCLE